jgi:hypothetical protein
VNQDESDRLAQLINIAELNFLRVRSTGDDWFHVSAGARGRIVCAGDLGTVERWLLRYTELIDAEVRLATRSRADLELEEMAVGPAAVERTGWPDGPQLRDPDVDAAALVHCAVVTSQLGALSELLFCNPGALRDGGDRLRITEFTTVLRRAAETLDGLLPPPPA